MKNIMKKYDLFGLSAPQIGLPLRLFIIAFPRPEDDFSQDEITRLEMKAFPHMVNIRMSLPIALWFNILTITREKKGKIIEVLPRDCLGQ